MSGRFIVFEGGEGAGKTTQAVRLAQHLAAGGYQILVTREPGDTPLGVRLRELLLAAGTVSPRVETLLFLADRAAHVEQVIQPALKRGEVVICDRFADSNIVYQGIARGLGSWYVGQMSRWAAQKLEPDLVIVLDVDPETGLARAGLNAPDRIERSPLTFHERVRAGYLARADLAENHRLNLNTHTRYVVVDATRPRSEVADLVAGAVAELFTEPVPAVGPEKTR